MNWNLRTFRLYNNDLWGTLLMGPTLTRPLKQLLRVRRKTRYFYKSIYGGFSKKLIKKRTKFKFFTEFYKDLTRRKGYHLIRNTYMPIDNVSKKTRAIKLGYFASYKRRVRLLKIRARRARISSALWKRLYYLFRNRYQFGYVKRNRFKKGKSKSGSKYIIDYTKRRSYDKLKVRLKRRTFNSQRLIDFRKFKKFYSNLTAVQFYRLASKSKIQARGAYNLNKFVSNLERRVDMVLFRSGLVTSIFMARHFISYGHISVNGLKIKRLGFVIDLYDIVSISIKDLINFFTIIKSMYLSRLKGYVKSGARKRVKSKVALVSIFKPSYLEVDYRVLSTILVADIQFNKVFYPFKVPFYELGLFLSRVRKKV
jgi:ribosomal protein S4